MAYQIEARTQDGHPYLEIRDIESGTVRLAWRHPAPDQTLPDDPIVRALVAEEALHHLFKRLFLLAAGQQPPAVARQLLRRHLSIRRARAALPARIEPGRPQSSRRHRRGTLLASFDLPAAVAIMP
ncbi:MAG TPA: hypothetical protein VFY81_13005 [Gammaproteobacteria bacterium]|nr:hypothetical protein [Gammaproteobacteria bacterium]